MYVIDYHDFTTKETTKEERGKLNTGDIWINAAECLGCGDTVRSKNRHHFVSCTCGGVSVDGGSYYARRSFKPDGPGFKNIIIPFDDVARDD